MTTVVDTSIVIKWFVPESDHLSARRLLDDEPVLAAPDLLVSELANVAWKKARRGEINIAQARLIVSGFPNSGIDLLPSFAVRERALEIALELGHPAYDCFYIAVAENLKTAVVTADRRLHAVAADSAFAPLVRLLS